MEFLEGGGGWAWGFEGAIRGLDTGAAIMYLSQIQNAAPRGRVDGDNHEIYDYQFG